MTAAAVIAALSLPADARVDQRVPKKLLVENGAPTAADKRQINDGIEELHWLAALKPDTIGVPAYRDDIREYLEIAVLAVSLRAGAKAARLTELIHRAIPYPVFLIQSQPESLALSLAHLRWSQGQAGQTVLDGLLITATLDAQTQATNDFLAALNVAHQPRHHLQAFYQGWIEKFDAYTAARLTGRFTLATDAAAECRRAALAEHDRLSREIAAIRTRAAKETQLNRRVDLNLQLKQLEARLAEVAKQA
ncbi:MAG: DUF4391 domain-containing protein [Acidobacteriota bacterium]|nr:DUF4391 domain-containing protein [Acidobacteriota bacterium]